MSELRETVEILQATTPQELARCEVLHREWKPTSLAGLGGTSRTMWSLIVTNGEDAGILGWHHDFGNWHDFSATLGLKTSDRGSYVVALYIKPALRSRGIGELVMSWLFKAAQRAGSRFLVAMPDISDQDGVDARVRFFERCGLTWVIPEEAWFEPRLMARQI